MFLGNMLFQFFYGHQNEAATAENQEKDGHKLYNQEAENTANGDLGNDSLNLQTLDVRVDSTG